MLASVFDGQDQSVVYFASFRPPPGLWDFFVSFCATTELVCVGYWEPRYLPPRQPPLEDDEGRRRGARCACGKLGRGGGQSRRTAESQDSRVAEQQSRQEKQSNGISVNLCVRA